MNIKTEKEDLIERLNKSNKIIIKLNKEIGKYEQCLDEIEKLQKELCRRCDLTFCGNTVCYEILQKIKEVKGNE